MNNGYEYYYLFGLDIPLDKYGLGKIRQPRLKDYLEKDISIESFYNPFLAVEHLAANSKDENIEELVKSFGRFNLLLEVSVKGNNFFILNELLNRLNFIYNVNDAIITDKAEISVGDIIINNDNFDMLCDVMIEMFKIDKSKIKFKKDEDLNIGITNKMLEAKRKYLERTKKKKDDDDKGLSILDVANAVANTYEIDYERVLNMTIFQIKNSFDVMNKKESYDISTLYRTNPGFDTSKMKFEHWTQQINLDKSTLSR